MTAILGFITGQWQRLAIYGALVLAFCVILFGYGYHVGVKRLWDYQAKQAQEAVKIIVKQGAVTEKIVTKWIKVKQKAEVVERIVEKEVIRYADKNPGMCLDPDWRRLHDSSTGAVPDTPGTVDGERGETVTAAEALTTVTQNNARCIRTADKLDALQEWVTAQVQIKP